MDWLKGLAPTLFEALTGNIPGAAVSAAAFLAKQFGWTNSNPDYVKQRLSTFTAEQQLQFAQLELQYQQEEDNANAVVIGDAQNARANQVALVQAGQKDLTVPVLSWIIMGMFFVLVLLLAFVPIPASNEKVFYMLAGTIGSFAAAVVGYWFGSSLGSKIKTSILQTQLDRNNLQ